MIDRTLPSVEPRVPTSGPWVDDGLIRLPPPCHAARRFVHRSGAVVLSAVEIAEPENLPEWHVSVSYRGGVADGVVMAMVRHDFGMEAAEEDNHGPGVVRHLWLRINPRDRRKECHCVNEVAPTIEGERAWRP